MHYTQPIAFDYTSRLILSHLSSGSLDAVHTAIGLLNAALKLARRSSARGVEWSDDIGATAVKLLSLACNTEVEVVEWGMVGRMAVEKVDEKVGYKHSSDFHVSYY